MKNITNNKGLTLIEILMGISIFVLAISALYFFMSQGFKVQEFSLQESIAISEARRSVETMVKEIRETQIADNGSYPIEKADKFEFIFYADIDKDNSVERVRYFLDGSEFKKGVIEPRVNPIGYFSSDEIINTLSRYVTNLSTEPMFEYYNGDWPTDTTNNPLTYPARETDVKFIKINLKINPKPSLIKNDFNLSSYVQVRNLKDNL